jgi:hypothetical protein
MKGHVNGLHFTTNGQNGVPLGASPGHIASLSVNHPSKVIASEEEAAMMG